jgi:hypothetical protein
MKLHDILSTYMVYDVQYANQLTNHLPMALVALERMGATEERKYEFASEYLRSKSIKKISASDVVINTTNWKMYLGQHQHYAGYITFFRYEFAHRGRDQVLREYLDLLMSGVSGGAFHALIKLAYGLDVDYDEEIINALAYFCICYLPLHLPEHVPDISAPLEVIHKLSQDSHFQKKHYFGNNIFSRIAEVDADPHFRNFACRLAIKPKAFQATLAKTVLMLYANTYDFTMLHAVTSNHALRLVLPYIQDKEQVFLFYWNALLAAYITIHCPIIKELRIAENDLPAWEKIFPRAVQSSDEHVVKFVYTCFEESQIYDNPAYQSLAAEKVGLVPTHCS